MTGGPALLVVASLVSVAGCGGVLTADQIRGDLRPAEKTRLMFAAAAGDVDTVRRALDEGENVNAKDDDLFTALHYAAANGAGESAAVLLEHGADLDAQTDYLYTPLHLAVFRADESMAAQLAAAGATLDFKDCFGKTPLHHAAAKQNEAVVFALLQAGASVIEASAHPSDLVATAASHQALAKLKELSGSREQARQELELAAQFYDRADRGFTEIREKAEKELRAQTITVAVVTAAAILAAVAADVGMQYQAQSRALQMSQIAALRDTSRGGGGFRMYEARQRAYYNAYRTAAYEQAVTAWRADSASAQVALAVQAVPLGSIPLDAFIARLRQAEGAAEAQASQCRQEAERSGAP